MIPRSSPGDAALVVAHPDDEVLWLSSALAGAARIVLVFGTPFIKTWKAEGRRRAVAALPFASRVVALGLPESGARFCFDHANPEPTGTGVAIAEAAARVRYDANFPRLVAALRPVLAGCATVFTHNPWGEYGHSEHIQVYRAVAALQEELGYTLWFPNYVARASWALARLSAVEPRWSERRVQAPDAATARRAMAVYLRHRAWTWTPWHRWPRQETLYAESPPADPAPRYALRGETLLDVAGLRLWLPPGHAARRLPG